jgi:hypothetical protein
MYIEGELQTKGTENVFNMIMAEIFPNLEKEMVIQVQDTFMTLNR